MKSANVFLFLALLTVAAIVTPVNAADEDGFKPLFDGKTLDGWVKTGGQATYHVDNGCVVGTVGPGPNTFLRTKKTYGDFILKLEMKYDEFGNSGIQIRSHQKDGGKGRVFGYQCEIDASKRAWSGGIYDESRRGWLYTLEGKEDARKSFKLDKWNKFVIKAVGPHIQTWINGVQCADLIDTADLDGFIALQVHGGKKGGIRWRNIRLKDLGVSKWVPLFNGKDFTGWDITGDGKWVVESGVIHGTINKTCANPGHLITKKQYTDLAIRLKYKMDGGNSGVDFRVKNNGDRGVVGVQAEISGTLDGGLWETHGRGWLMKPEVGKVQIPNRIKNKTWCKPGVWSDMSIVAIGPRIVTMVNGIKVADIIDKDGRPQGHLGLQLHCRSDMDARFKDIEIMETPSERK